MATFKKKFDRNLPPGNLVNRRAAKERGWVYNFRDRMYRIKSTERLVADYFGYITCTYPKVPAIGAFWR